MHPLLPPFVAQKSGIAPPRAILPFLPADGADDAAVARCCSDLAEALADFADAALQSSTLAPRSSRGPAALTATDLSTLHMTLVRRVQDEHSRRVASGTFLPSRPHVSKFAMPTRVPTYPPLGPSTEVLPALPSRTCARLDCPSLV